VLKKHQAEVYLKVVETTFKMTKNDEFQLKSLGTSRVSWMRGKLPKARLHIYAYVICTRADILPVCPCQQLPTRFDSSLNDIRDEYRLKNSESMLHLKVHQHLFLLERKTF